MSSKKVRFTFSTASVTEPLVYQLGHEFKVVTNIRMADVDEKIGWVILELIGNEAEIIKSLEWVSSKGVRIDPLEGDVIAG
ncbi:MAG: NIL domain-containing protein [Dehalococcoidia bacterium]|jgi:ABC-type methionine transport system ATPase subunit|nr:MAG: NIL domain-containing protein [Chloroflexota bacterium]|tara:strand:- start:4000 stop:4242 length:243 start_codon:yes stop_codon:yes gene_type:complete